MHAAYWNLIVGVFSIFVLFCLLPIIHLYSNQNLEVYLIVEEFRQVSNLICYGGLAFCISSSTIMLDLVSDFFESPDSFSVNSLLNNKHVWFGRCFYAISTFLVGIQYLLQYDYFHIFPTSQYHASFWFATYCHRIVILTTLMFFVSISDQNSAASTFRKTITVTILFCMSTILQVFDSFLRFKFQLIVHLVRISYIFYFVPSFLLFSHLFYQIWKTRAKWMLHNYAQFLYVNLFLFVALPVPLICLIVVIIFGKLIYATTIIIIFSVVLITIILTVIPGRIARKDAITSKDHIIATKESYVRYLSHEMRTPMNILHSGINLGIDEVSKRAEDRTELDIDDHLDTLIDVKEACETALQILNDFLLYDKLRNGKVELQKKTVCTFDFVSKCLKSFTLHLRAKHIKLDFLNIDKHIYTLPLKNHFCIQIGQSKTEIESSIESETHAVKFLNANTISENANNRNNSGETQAVDNGNCGFTYIQNDDEMNIDEHKLSQVIRNLLSNAIKFTPEKGNIQVVIGFMPDAKDVLSDVGNRTHATTIVGYFYNILERVRSSWSSFNRSSSNVSEYSIVNNPVDSLADDIELGTPVFGDEMVSGMLRIEIQDSGAGISPENQTRLFKEVVQFDPDVLQAGGGSGMGLFISKDLVDMHGGRISVYSEGVGKGTTFRLEIPMCRKRKRTISLSSYLSYATYSSDIQPDISPVTSEQPTYDTHNEITPFDDSTLVLANNQSEISHSIENIAAQQSSQVNENFNFSDHPIYESSTFTLFEPPLHSANESLLKDVDTVFSTKSKTSYESVNNISSSIHILSEGCDMNTVEQRTNASIISVKKQSRSEKHQKQNLASKTNENIQVNVPRKCLIVDDVPTNRKMLMKHLKGHYCHEASDGDVAVDMVKAVILAATSHSVDSSNSSSAVISYLDLPLDSPARNYDIIFMDYVMPNMPGPDATKAIRDLGYTGLIYGVTGNSLPVDIATFMTAGATDVIIKPLKKQDLLNMRLFAPNVDA